MEIPIDSWEFVLNHCNEYIPQIVFTPTKKFLELNIINNSQLFVVIKGTKHAEYDGKIFLGVSDKKADSSDTCYWGAYACKPDLAVSKGPWTLTFKDAPYVKDVKGGEFEILDGTKSRIKSTPPSKPSPTPSTPTKTPTPPQSPTGLDNTVLWIIGGIVIIGFASILVTFKKN